MMEIIFDGRSSLKHYGLILKSYTLTSPVRKRYLYSVPGGDGDVDLMKGLGPARYENRTLRAEFTISASNPKQTVDKLLNELEGATVPIILPDDPSVYLEGDIHISAASVRQGGALVILATCLPWRYRCQDTVIDVHACEADTVHTWYNEGKRDAVPELTVLDTAYITVGGSTLQFDPGTHITTALAIPGRSAISVTIRGGALTARYKEAIL